MAAKQKRRWLWLWMYVIFLILLLWLLWNSRESEYDLSIEELQQRCNISLYQWGKAGPRRLQRQLREYAWLGERVNDWNAAEFRCQHAQLQYALFPFIRRKFRSMIERTDWQHERGIAVVCSPGHVHFVLTLLENLRILGSQLPVEVFYSGRDKLTLQDRQQLENSGARLVDVQPAVQGWGKAPLKPLALLLSSFRQTLLLNSDVLFLANPEQLFDEQLYEETGSLFFANTFNRSRAQIGPHWFDGNMPTISERLEKLQIYRGLSNMQMHPGVILVDKGRHQLVALAACRIVARHERDWFEETFSDTDAFWLAFELLDRDYSVYPGRCGVMGDLYAEQSSGRAMTCGHIMQSSVEGRPLWWNGGMRTSHDLSAQMFAAFAVPSENELFIFKPLMTCLWSAVPKNLNAREIDVVAALADYWTALRAPFLQFNSFYSQLLD